jgi:hypothetical protein
MRFRKQTDEVNRIYYIELGGELKIPENIKAYPEVLGDARENNYFKFVFDVRQVDINVNYFDSFHLIQHLDILGLRRTDNIALIYSGREELFKFCETVAYNRGWHNFKFFGDLSEGKSGCCHK